MLQVELIKIQRWGICMQYNEGLKVKGKYEFYNCSTGEVKEYDNVVCQNFFTQLFKSIKNEANDIYAKNLQLERG